MTYLWLTRHFPYPPLKGGDVDYSRNLIESLAKYEKVHVLAFHAPGVLAPARANIAWFETPYTQPPRWRSLGSPLPNVAYRHLSADYLREAVEAARACSAVFVDFIGMFWIVEPLRAAMASWPSRPSVIVINHNVERDIRWQMVAAERSPFKAVLALDAFKATSLERRANATADGIVANTPADEIAFNAMVKTPSVVVMPAYAGARVESRTIDAATPRRVVILGHRDAHHKRLVLDHVLAAIAAQGVDKRVKIEIVGSGDLSEFREKYPGFDYLGHVDDLEPYLLTCRMGVIADDIGGGFKIRALSHAFCRLPILALDAALSGMGFVSGRHYAGVETMAQLAAGIEPLLMDEARLNRLQDAAFEHVRTAFDWADRGRDLHEFAVGLARPNR